MQVAPNSDGIQKLLGAEQEASRIVAEARKGAVSVHRAPRALPCIRCITQHTGTWIMLSSTLLCLCLHAGSLFCCYHTKTAAHVSAVLVWINPHFSCLISSC
jgi:hypothetical protein